MLRETGGGERVTAWCAGACPRREGWAHPLQLTSPRCVVQSQVVTKQHLQHALLVGPRLLVQEDRAA